MIGPVISPIALIVADFESIPSPIHRSTFSRTTIASSTTMPMASTSPNNVRLFRLNPSKYMIASVPTSDTGTSIIGRIIAFQSWRKRRTTIATRRIASISVLNTSSIDWVINGVVS